MSKQRLSPPMLAALAVVPLGVGLPHRHRHEHRTHHRARLIAPAGKASRRASVFHANRQAASRQLRVPIAHLAGDPGDTISDFRFSPSSLTIQVGQTVTWTNNGPSPHSATASNGSFDTGILNSGQSGSHTFSQAGTFSYICKIHPFMHGTIVVLGSTGSGGSSGSGGSPGAGSGSGAGSSSAGSSGSGSAGSGSATTAGATTSGSTAATAGHTLPNTGLNLLATLGTALLLLAAGGALSRRAGALR